MQKLNIQHDRYDGAPLEEKIDSRLLRFGANEAWMEFPLGEEEDFEIYFDVVNGNVDPELLTSAKTLMRSVGRLDNQVQDSCAAECKRTGLHPRNYESRLAYVRVSRSGALLRYFGTGVNTEWDEAVELRGGDWVLVGIRK